MAVKGDAAGSGNSKARVRSVVEHQTGDLLALSHRIHTQPEIAFQEEQASTWVADALETRGFRVVRAVAALPTAFKAEFGSGSLNIGICAEYDALPGIGHACGHNVIAAAAVGAATALSEVADDLNLTITVLGTPAEEGGGAKILMLQRGVFDGLNASMMIHPHATERDTMGTLAVSQIYVDFYGRPAHAAARPEQGRNAASALALAQVGIGVLREHIADSARVHGIVVNGGDAPNIVPAHTRGRWFIRTPFASDLEQLEPRVYDVFKGAALMTGCDVEIVKSAPTYSELSADPALSALWRSNASALGRQSLPLQPGDSAASTDMGNVSLAMPAIHPLIAMDARGANIHERGFAEHAVSASADSAVVDGAIAMAWTAIDMATDETIRNRLTSRTFRAGAVRGADRTFLGEDFETPIRFGPGAPA